MKRLIMFILIMLSIIFQTTIMSFLDIRDVSPNIVLLCIIVFSMNTDFFTAIFMGLFAGIVTDFLVLNCIGINSLAYFVIAYICNYLRYELDLEKKIVNVATVVVATLIYHGITLFIIFFMGYDISNIYYIVEKVLIQIILNSLLFFLISKIIGKIFALLKIKLQEESNENIA